MLTSDFDVVRIGDYTNNASKIKFYCNKCKEEFYTYLCSITERIKNSKQICPMCNNRKRRLDNRIIDSRLKNSGITRIGDYVTANHSIEWMDANGYVWMDTPANVVSNYKKNGKHNHIKITNEVIDERMKNRKIKRIGNYIDKDTPIEWVCLETGDIWKCLPNNIFRGYGNPNLKTYKREKDILNLLKKNNENFEYHKEIKTNNRKFIVDFYLVTKNTVIEYNGKQHYHPVEYFGGQTRFEKQVERDNSLRKYCNDVGINLVEIPYSYSWDRIQSVINNVLKGG